MRAMFFGSGRASLTAATGLARDGWRVEMFARHSTPEILGGPPALTQVALPHTRSYEASLGLDLWSDSAPVATAVRLAFSDGAAFCAPLPGRATAIDPRLSTAYWLQALEELGGKIHVRNSTSADIAALAPMYHVRVVGAGDRSELRNLFGADDQRTSGAASRAVAQIHVTDYPWPENPLDTGPEAGVCIEMISTPDAEIIVQPVLGVSPLSADLVRRYSSHTLDRNIAVPTTAAACVQVLARPDGALAPPEATAEDRTDQRRGELQAATVWEYLHQALGQVDAQLAERVASSTMLPGSALLREVHPQVRHPVTTLGGHPVLGLGDITKTADPMSGQGAAASTLVASTLLDHLRRYEGTAAPDAALLQGVWEDYNNAHGQYTDLFALATNAYWSRDHPLHQHVRAMVADVGSQPDNAALWGRGLDQPSLMAPLLPST